MILDRSEAKASLMRLPATRPSLASNGGIAILPLHRVRNAEKCPDIKPALPLRVKLRSADRPRLRASDPAGGRLAGAETARELHCFVARADVGEEWGYAGDRPINSRPSRCYQ